MAAYSSRLCSPVRWECLGSSGGFSGAVIMRLETSAGPFCLRGWPARSLPRRRILGLHRLLGTVFEAGVREVAVPVPALNGETLVLDRTKTGNSNPGCPAPPTSGTSPTTGAARKT